MKKYVNNCDLIISSHFPFNYIASTLNKYHINCCWEPYAFFHDENYVKGFNFYQQIFIKIMGIVYKKLDIIGTQKADKVLTLSEFNKKWVQKIYHRDDAIVSYEGVDTDFFKFTVNKTLQNKYKKNVCLLHSTDFTAIKGTVYLIQALPVIVKKIHNVKVLITHTLNNPDKKQEIVDLAVKLGVVDNIEFLGRIDYHLLPSYYSISRVVVQPSINQSMSLSVKEAMACSRPIITCLEGYEQTKDGEAGFLVNPKDITALANAVTSILQNQKLADHMGQKGREIIKQKFSWPAVAKVYSDTIKGIQL